MDIFEYEKVKNLKYLEYCDYLQNKYGLGLSDYMTKSWNKNPKVSRTSEGLVAHHKYEDHAILLSKPEHAKQNPFEWQTAKNIIYCDLLEHLFLHILICENPAPDHNEREEVGIGGVINFLVPELNDVYSGWESSVQWQKNCHGRIRNDQEVYIQLLIRFGEARRDFLIQYPDCLYTSYNEKCGRSDIWSCEKNAKIFEIIEAVVVDAE